MEKWIPTEAVEFLEKGYDVLVWDWCDDDQMQDYDTGWMCTVVVIVDADGFPKRTIRRMYGGPMFWVKDYAETGPSVEMPSHALGQRCDSCARGIRHRCENCGTEVEHMTGIICPACWD